METKTRGKSNGKPNKKNNNDWLKYIFYKMRLILGEDKEHQIPMLEFISTFEQRLYNSDGLNRLEKAYRGNKNNKLVPSELIGPVNRIKNEIEEGRAYFDTKNGNQLAFHDDGEDGAATPISVERFNNLLGHDYFIDYSIPYLELSKTTDPEDNVNALTEELIVSQPAKTDDADLDDDDDFDDTDSKESQTYDTHSWLESALILRSNDVSAVKNTFDVNSLEEFDETLMRFIEHVCIVDDEDTYTLYAEELNSAIQPFISPEEYRKEFSILPNKKVLYADSSLKGKKARNQEKYHGMFTTALVYRKKINEVSGVPDIAQNNAINRVEFKPFTKKEILDRSVGQIISSELDLSKNEEVYSYNTLVNRLMFADPTSDHGILDSLPNGSKCRTNLPGSMNYGHIWMPLPVVNPTLLGLKSYEGSSTKTRGSKVAPNKLRAMLGVYASTPSGSINKVLADLVFYDWCLILPKTPEDKKKISELINENKSTSGSTRSGSGNQSPLYVIRTLNYAEKNDDSGQNWVFAPHEYTLVNREFLNKTLKPNGWTERLYVLSGAYAITYLLSQIDIKRNVKCGSEHLKLKYHEGEKNVPVSTAPNVSMDVLVEHIKILTGILEREDASLLDWITNIIPVVPLTYRPCTKRESGNRTITQVDSLNTKLYQPILGKLNSFFEEVGKLIKSSRSSSTSRDEGSNYSGKIVPYEVLFEYGRDVNIDENSGGSGAQKQRERLAYCLKTISELIDDNICNSFKDIQGYLCKTAEEQMNLLGGKYGYIRDNCLTKRINDTGRSVITVDPNLKIDEIGIPYNILKCWYENDIRNYVRSAMGIKPSDKDSHKEYEKLFRKWINFMSDSEETTYAKVNSNDTEGINNSLKVVVSDSDGAENSEFNFDTKVEKLNPEQLRLMRNRVEELVIKRLNQLIERDRAKVLVIRFPSLWKYNELTMNIKLVRDDSIHFHPLCCACYNADFDGDQISVYLLRTPPAIAEAERLLMPSVNKVGYNGDPMLMPSQDAILGLYYLTLNKNTEDILNNTCNVDTEDSPVLKTFSCYDEMYAAYERHEVGLFDKVRVYLPHYTNSNFLTEYLTQTELEKPQSPIEHNLTFPRSEDSDTKRPYEITTSGDKVSVVLQTHSKEENSGTDYESNFTGTLILGTQLRGKKQPVISTVGRFIFNNSIPQDLGFVKRDKDNYDNPCNFELEIDDKSIKSILGVTLSGTSTDSRELREDVKKVLAAPKKVIKSILSSTIDKYDSGNELGSQICNCVHDNLKTLGFTFATLSGLSLSLDDMKTNPAKDRIMKAYTEKINKIYKDPSIAAEEERKEKAISTWEECTKKVMNATLEGLPVTNTLRMMSFSGARGSDSQLSQLMGMRGIMLDADSRKVETPIKNSFIEGIYPEDFFIASAGTNKGMIDRANKTQDTGAFTRTMIFGTEGIHIGSGDCGDHEGMLLYNTPTEAYNYDIHLGTGYMNIQDRSKGDPGIIYVTKGVLQKDGTAIIDPYGNYYINSKPVYNIYTRRILSSEDVTIDSDENHILISENGSSRYFNAVLSDGTEITIDTNVTFYADNSIASLTDSMLIRFPDDNGSGVYLKFTNSKMELSPYITSEREVGAIGQEPIFKESSTGNTDKYVCNGMPINGPDVNETYGDEWSFSSSSGDCEYSRKIPTVNGMPEAIIEIDGDYSYTPFTTCVSAELGTQLGNDKWFLEYDDDNDWVSTQQYDKEDGIKITYNTNKTLTVKLNNDAVSMLDNTVNPPCGFLFASKPVGDAFIGRFVAQTVYDKITGDVLLSVDKPITKDDKSKVKKALQQYPEGLFIRSPMSCKSHAGICAKCYGYNYGANRYARIGDQVDKSSSHVLGEYLSQSTMRTFHTGGAATGGNVTDTFKAIKALLESGDIKDKYMQSLIKGIKTKGGGDDTAISQEEIMRIQDLTRETLSDVYLDEWGEFEGFAGQPLNGIGLEAFGVANMVYFTELQKYLMTQINSILGTSGLSVKNVHIEVMLRSLLQHFTIVDSGDSPRPIGTDIEIHDLIKSNVDLVRGNGKTIVVVPTVYKLNKSAFSSDSPMQQMQYREVTKSFTESVMQNKNDNLKSGITTVMVGNSVYAGDKIMSEAEATANELPQVSSIDSLIEDKYKGDRTSYADDYYDSVSKDAVNSDYTPKEINSSTHLSFTKSMIDNVVSNYRLNNAPVFDEQPTEANDGVDEQSVEAPIFDEQPAEVKPVEALVFGAVTGNVQSSNTDDVDDDEFEDVYDDYDLDYDDNEDLLAFRFNLDNDNLHINADDSGYEDKNMTAYVFDSGSGSHDSDDESDKNKKSDKDKKPDGDNDDSDGGDKPGKPDGDDPSGDFSPFNPIGF